MPTLVFDTHAYVKRLKAAGVPEEQAEIHPLDSKRFTGSHPMAVEHAGAERRSLGFPASTIVSPEEGLFGKSPVELLHELHILR